jgi:hypothetical protein
MDDKTPRRRPRAVKADADAASTSSKSPAETPSTASAKSTPRPRKAVAAKATKAAKATEAASQPTATPARVTADPKPKTQTGVRRSPAKTTAAVKQATPEPAQAPQQRAPEPPDALPGVPPTDAVIDGPAPLAASLWTSIRANPGYAPELLAVAAVAHLGRDAAAQLAGLRHAYPGATPDGLARLATRRFIRHARNRGALVGLAGPVPILTDAALLLWDHAGLVLHLAAGYGLDPADRRRAAEILMLQGIHPNVSAAEEAITQAEHPATESMHRLAVPLSRLAAKGVLRLIATRGAARLVPGAGAVVGALANARSIEWLAIRAQRHYREQAH